MSPAGALTLEVFEVVVVVAGALPLGKVLEVELVLEAVVLEVTPFEVVLVEVEIALVEVEVEAVEVAVVVEIDWLLIVV